MSNNSGFTVIIDGDNFLHRSLHIPSFQEMKRRDGFPTGIIFGCLRMLMTFLDSFTRPVSRIYFLVGEGECQFRKEIFPAYKFQSEGKKTDWNEKLSCGYSKAELFSSQKKLLIDNLQNFGIFCFSHNGYEADDLSYFLSCAHKEYDENNILAISEDRDWLQLIRTGCAVFIPSKGVFVDSSNFEDYSGGVPQNAFSLSLAMLGGHDGIPGVLKGFGPKSFLKLVAELSNYNLDDWGDVERGIQAWCLRNSKKFSQLGNPECISRLRKNASLTDFRNVPLSFELRQSIFDTVRNRSVKFDFIEALKFLKENELSTLGGNILSNPIFRGLS